MNFISLLNISLNIIHIGVFQDCGKGYVYPVVVSFYFSVFFGKGIFRVHATLR